MSELWDQQEGEKSAEYDRFLLFRNMPPRDRSILGAYKLAWLAQQLGGKKQKRAELPNRIPSSWTECADKWQWRKRADAYDVWRRAEDEAKAERLRQLEEEEEAALLSTGYARSSQRIKQLSALYDELKASYREGGMLEGKIIYQWLTPDKVREMRGCLDDIAKEVGDRVKKSELTGKDGNPIEFVCEWGSGSLEDSDDEG